MAQFLLSILAKKKTASASTFSRNPKKKIEIRPFRVCFHRNGRIFAEPPFPFPQKTTSMFHCAAISSESKCLVPAARFYFVRFPQAQLALLASHGVTEVKHLRCFEFPEKNKKKGQPRRLSSMTKFVGFVDKRKNLVCAVEATGVRFSCKTPWLCGSVREFVVPVKCEKLGIRIFSHS